MLTGILGGVWGGHLKIKGGIDFDDNDSQNSDEFECNYSFGILVMLNVCSR